MARRFSLLIPMVALFLPAPCGIALAANSPGFSFRDKPGKHLDILLNGKIVARYMYAYDKSSKKHLEETFKPYLHVYDAKGKTLLTKGPGGLYSHHRGIFVGWMKIGHNGKTYDRWHMKGGEIVHQKFLEEKADQHQATFTSLTHWNDNAGKSILKEERTMSIRPAPGVGRLLIDFTTRLTAVDGDITLDGDPEHSGVQFRPANKVEKKETVYLFPVEQAKPHKDVDYPWVGETFTLHGKHYSVVEFNHPDNPKKTRWSAYRDYGRLGVFPKAGIKSSQTLVLKYQFLVADGDLPPAEAIQKLYDRFAGLSMPPATPKTTRLPAEQPAPAKKKTKKSPKK